MELIIVHEDGTSFVQELSTSKIVTWHHSDTNRYLSIQDNYAKKELLLAHNDYHKSPVKQITIRRGSSDINITNIYLENYSVYYNNVLSEYLQFCYNEG